MPEKAKSPLERILSSLKADDLKQASRETLKKLRGAIDDALQAHADEDEKNTPPGQMSEQQYDRWSRGEIEKAES